MTRRRALGLLAAAGASALAGNGRALGDANPPGDVLDGGRVALQATTGPPQLPATIRLRMTDGTFCSTPMDEYLKAVVPSEVPASWPAEAVKAQAVAARTYAASYHATYGYICTTTACQAWDPTKRHALSDAAIAATAGEVMTYQGGMIWSYYSSTCGGQTQTSPDQASAYCRAIRCWREADGRGRDPADLSSEAAAAAFWGVDNPPPSFCSISPSFRYSWSLSRDEQTQIVDRYLPGVTTVSPRYSAGQLGELREIVAASRNQSGKITALRVVGTGGTWTVTGETAIRSLLRTGVSSSAGRSAKAVLTLERDGGGSLLRVNGRAGGFGHGIGLCQYGAKGMADARYDYRTILAHYYSGVEIVRATSRQAASTPGRRVYLPFAYQGGGESCG